MRKRNGKIELMRFFFSVGVLVFHINRALWENKKDIFPNISLCTHGNIGVEFFFLVSGFLMAKSIDRQLKNTPVLDASHLGDDTLQFLWRKVKGILPYHLIFALPMILVMWAIAPEKQPAQILSGLPSLLLINRTGIMGNFSNIIGPEWYISSMLLAMAILFPFCKRYYSNFTHLAAPLLAILLLGWMNQTSGHLSTSTQWDGLTFHCNLRALAELSLGTTCYEITKIMDRHTFSFLQQLSISVAEGLCYLLTFCFLFSRLSYSYEVYVVFLLAVAITLSFSQKGLLGNSALFQNNLCLFLGGISLPIYLIQDVFRYSILYLTPFAPKWKALLMLSLSLLFGSITYLIVTTVQNRKKA